MHFNAAISLLPNNQGLVSGRKRSHSESNETDNNNKDSMSTVVMSENIASLSWSRAGRSVLDYENIQVVTKALEDVAINSGNDSQNQQSDWKLPLASASSSFSSYDNTTDQAYLPQDVSKEAKRLEVLRDYLVLDTDQGEAFFETITKQAGDHFQVPWAVISFVDLGRVWFKSWSKKDLDKAQVARTSFFCAHTILCKEQVFCCQDTSQDARFAQTPPLNQQGQRFYAGVPLVVPEGERIGTFCIMDSKPWPSGLSSNQVRDLESFADRTVKLLVARRDGLKRLLSSTFAHQSAKSLIPIAASSPAPPSHLEKMPVSPRLPRNIKNDAPGWKSGDDSASNKKTRSGSLVLEPEQPQDIIARPVTSVILPDPKTDIDPDTYLARLVEAMYGAKLSLKTGLELGDFFDPITEDQIGAYSMRVVSLARNNDTEGLKKIFEEEGRAALDCFNRFGEGLLNLCCRRGYTSTVKFLLSDEVQLSVRIRDDFGRTPLHDACWNPEPLVEICHCLMEKDPSLFFITDKRGYTPFQYARSTDWPLWRQFLLDRRHLLAPLASAEIRSRFS